MCKRNGTYGIPHFTLTRVLFIKQCIKFAVSLLNWKRTDDPFGARPAAVGGLEPSPRHRPAPHTPTWAPPAKAGLKAGNNASTAPGARALGARGRPRRTREGIYGEPGMSRARRLSCQQSSCQPPRGARTDLPASKVSEEQNLTLLMYQSLLKLKKK